MEEQPKNSEGKKSALHLYLTDTIKTLKSELTEPDRIRMEAHSAILKQGLNEVFRKNMEMNNFFEALKNNVENILGREDLSIAIRISRINQVIASMFRSISKVISDEKCEILNRKREEIANKLIGITREKDCVARKTQKRRLLRRNMEKFNNGFDAVIEYFLSSRPDEVFAGNERIDTVKKELEMDPGPLLLKTEAEMMIKFFKKSDAYKNLYREALKVFPVGQKILFKGTKAYILSYTFDRKIAHSKKREDKDAYIILIKLALEDLSIKSFVFDESAISKCPDAAETCKETVKDNIIQP